MSVGPIPASSATAYGMQSTENVGAQMNCPEPKGSAPTTISGPNENDGVMNQVGVESTAPAAPGDSGKSESY